MLAKKAFYLTTAAEPLDNKEFVSFLAGLELFREQPLYRLKELLAGSHVRAYLENDRILAARHLQTDMLFVLSGKVIRSRDSGDGWLDMIDIQGPGTLVNEMALLAPESVLAVEAAAEKVSILAVPLENFVSLIQADRGIGLPLTRHLLRELDIYEKRWMKS